MNEIIKTILNHRSIRNYKNDMTIEGKFSYRRISI